MLSKLTVSLANFIPQPKDSPLSIKQHKHIRAMLKLHLLLVVTTRIKSIINPNRMMDTITIPRHRRSNSSPLWLGRNPTAMVLRLISIHNNNTIRRVMRTRIHLELDNLLIHLISSRADLNFEKAFEKSC
jgi:hypothetical protein